MACKCHKIGAMKKRTAGKSKVTIDMEALMYATAGAVVSLAANAVIKKAIESQGENIKTTVTKFLPIAKAAGGYFLVTMSDDKRMAYAGIGIMAESATEMALVAAPKIFVIDAKMAGFGDVYTAIGDPYKYDSLPGASMGAMDEDVYTEGDELIAGAGNSADLIV